jgi:signal transduction histidine kinase
MRSALFRRRALRTATVAVGLVAVILAAVLTATDILVQRSLSEGVNQRLEEGLDRIDLATLAVPRHSALPDRDFDEPILAWLIRADGTTVSTTGAPDLPRSLRVVTSATEARVGATSFLLEGTVLPGGTHVVVAASLAQSSQVMRTLLLSELIIGPLLLALVFGGALLIGRRVAGPVERVRQRQLAFTADASHELRTPLSVIQAEATLALSGRNGELRTALGRIAGEGRRMRSILDDLLWLARFDSEPARPTAEVLDLGALAVSAADRFASVAEQRSVHIDIAVPETPVVISAPPEWVHRLVAILTDNGCRHARSGGRVVVHVSVIDGHRAQLSVSDDGDGIPQTELDSIFERFHRATSEGEGAGLGLAIADAVVRGTHAVWDVGNLPGGGARFAVTWEVVRT